MVGIDLQSLLFPVVRAGFSILRTEKTRGRPAQRLCQRHCQRRAARTTLAWLYVIVRNEALMLLRRRQRRLAMRLLPLPRTRGCGQDCGADPYPSGAPAGADILAEMNPRTGSWSICIISKRCSGQYRPPWGEGLTVRVRHHRIKKMLAAQLAHGGTRDPVTRIHEQQSTCIFSHFSFLPVKR